jgi:hypothetical protein
MGLWVRIFRLFMVGAPRWSPTVTSQGTETLANLHQGSARRVVDMLGHFDTMFVGLEELVQRSQRCRLRLRNLKSWSFTLGKSDAPHPPS